MESLYEETYPQTFAILFSLDHWMLSVYSLEVLPVEDEMRHLLKKMPWKCVNGLVRLPGLSRSSSQAGREVYTQRGGNWGPPSRNWLAGEKTHNTDIWRSPDEPAGSPADEPCLHEPDLTRASRSFLVSFSLFSTYIFIYGKCKHTEKLKNYYKGILICPPLKYYNC